jgi:hypothetical protein
MATGSPPMQGNIFSMIYSREKKSTWHGMIDVIILVSVRYEAGKDFSRCFSVFVDKIIFLQHGI